MNDFFECFEHAERTLREEYGPFALFALVRRTEGQGQWDVVVSAPELDTDKKKKRTAFASEISDWMREDQVMQLSRIVFLDADEQTVSALQTASRHSNATSVLNRSGAFGFEIEGVYFISTSGYASPEAIAMR